MEMKDRSLDALKVSFRVVLTCPEFLFGRLFVGGCEQPGRQLCVNDYRGDSVDCGVFSGVYYLLYSGSAVPVIAE